MSNKTKPVTTNSRDLQIPLRYATGSEGVATRSPVYRDNEFYDYIYTLSASYFFADFRHCCTYQLL